MTARLDVPRRVAARLAFRTSQAEERWSHHQVPSGEAIPIHGAFRYIQGTNVYKHIYYNVYIYICIYIYEYNHNNVYETYIHKYHIIIYECVYICIRN